MFFEKLRDLNFQISSRPGSYGTIFGEMALQNDKDRAATIEWGPWMILDVSHDSHVRMALDLKIRLNEHYMNIYEHDYNYIYHSNIWQVDASSEQSNMVCRSLHYSVRMQC